MQNQRKRYPRKFRLALLLLFVIGFIGFVVFAILSERQRIETLGAIETPPELRFHHQLAEAIAHQDAEPEAATAPELQPALDTIAAWRALLQSKKDDVDGDEWDAVTDFWYEADGWDNLAPEQIARIGAFLEKHGEFLTALRQTAALGGPMEVVPQYPERLDMEHLRQVRDSARLLQLDATYQAHAGNSDVALADLIAGFQLGRCLATEPALMPQLVRFACTMMTYHALLEGFPPGTLSAAAAAQLLEEVRQDPGRSPMVLALEEQRIATVGGLNAKLELGWGERYADMERLFSYYSMSQRAGLLVYASPLARPWLNKDFVRVSEMATNVIEIAHLPRYETFQRYSVPDTRFRPYTSIFSVVFRNLDSQARHEALLQLLQLGLALEQWPEPPESLDVLNGQFPEETLTDPFTGERFRYVPDGNTFLLYSVGENRVDDGGHHDFNAGDIVWRSTW